MPTARRRENARKISSSAWPSPCAGSAKIHPRARRPELQIRRAARVKRTSRGPMPAVSIRTSRLRFEALEHSGELLAAVRRMHGRAENARIGHELFARADAIAVGAHQRQILAAVLHAPSCGEFGDGRRLARTRGPDHCDDAGVDRAQLLDHGQMPESSARGRCDGFFKLGCRGRQLRQRHGNIRRNVHR